MNRLYRRKGILGALTCSIALTVSAQAQQEYGNWYLGNQAGISFATGTPQSVATSAMTTYEGCSSISSSTGQLLMYSNGENVWDTNHQVMPNGGSLGSHNSASQGVIILRAPESNSKFYIFTVDAIDNNLVGGLRYSIVDMSLRGGLGDVITKAIRLPTPTVNEKVTEKLTAALHANGKDYWIVVHGWQNNRFFSFHLSSNGINTTPVVSNIGPVHQGGGSFFGAANAVGYMKISPDGKKLALAQRDTQFELYDYNNTSGQVSNYANLMGMNTYHYGVEFSSDNSLLYTTMYSDGGISSDIYQYNLLAGSAGDIQNSRQVVATVSGLSGAIQRGPDGKLYVSSLNRQYISSIDYPNNLGVSCGFRYNSVYLGQRNGQIGLPNIPNAVSSLVTKNYTYLKDKIAFFPNPVNDKITVVIPQKIRKYNGVIALFNVLGNKVGEYKFQENQEQYTFSLLGLTKGLYTIELKSEGGANIGKFVID